MAFASDATSVSIDELLMPYVEVLNKVNAKTGKGVYIPAGKEASVYAYYKDYTPAQFENELL